MPSSLENVAQAIPGQFAEYAFQEMRIRNKDKPDEAIDVEIKAVSMQANRMMLEEMEPVSTVLSRQ